jgi:hypothetical protein
MQRLRFLGSGVPLSPVGPQATAAVLCWRRRPLHFYLIVYRAIPPGRVYPPAPAYQRPPIDVLCLTVPVVFYTQTVPGLGAHARSSPGAWSTAPSGRRERGKNTARRPKNGCPTGLSKSCTRPFNAPQARGRARSRPRPSPRLHWRSGHFLTYHRRAAEACRPVSCRSSCKRGSPPSLRAALPPRRRPDAVHGMGRRGFA